MEHAKDDGAIIRLKNEEVIRLCSESKGDVIWFNKYGAKVLRLSTSVAVKFGLGVNKEEAANQDYVYRNVDHRKLRVPGVLRFFEDSSSGAPLIVGYLVMEFIEGTDLAKLTAAGQSGYLGQITAAMDALSEMSLPTNAIPGPIGGGGTRGSLWPDCRVPTTFNSIADLEHWLNLRILASQKFGFEAAEEFNLGEVKLTMCHMDIAPRNIIAMPDGKICFVDWAYAGLFPRFFQDYQLYASRTYDEPEFFEALIHELLLPPIIDKSQQYLWGLGIVQSMNGRASFESSIPKSRSLSPWAARWVSTGLLYYPYSMIAGMRWKLTSMWGIIYRPAPPPAPAPPPRAV